MATYNVNGVDYNNGADATTQMIADGTPGEVVYFAGVSPLTENVTTPTQAQVATTAINPIIYRVNVGDSVTINGYYIQTSNAADFIVFRGLTLVRPASYVAYSNGNIKTLFDAVTITGNLWLHAAMLDVIDCVIDSSATTYTFSVGSIKRLSGCRIKGGSTQVVYAPYGKAASIYNNRIDCNGGRFFVYQSYESSCPVICHNTFYNASSLLYHGFSADGHFAEIHFINNLIDTYTRLIEMPNRPPLADHAWDRFGGNVLSNRQGASDIVNFASNDIADLTALQALGYDDTDNPSVENNRTMASTTVTSDADFLRPTVVDWVKQGGIWRDAAGAARKNWLVEAGALQQNASDYDADKVTKDATPAGNWNNDNILDQDDATANFRTALAVGVGLTGGLTPSGGQSSPPTALSIADNGDGQTWLVTATGQGANAAIYLYNHSGDALVAIVDASGQTKDLTAGISVYAKALENNKTLSDRYPAASGVAVPSLAAGAAPTAPALSVVDSEDAATATAAVSGADAGTTNRIYTCPVGQNTWTLKATVTGDGDATLSGLTMLEYYVKVASTNNVGSSCGQVVVFWITNGRSARTRIRDRVAGAATKIASRLGVSLTFTAVGEDAVTLQALVLRSEYMTGMIGQTDKTFIDFQVPRQSAFPPSSISVGDTVTYNSTEYMIDKYTPDNEDIQQASTFELKCWRFGQMCEIDG